MLGICSCDYADGEVPCGRSRRSGGMIQCKSEGRRTRSARARGQEWMGHPCSIPRVSSCPPPFCSMEIRRGSEGAYHTHGAGGLLPSPPTQCKSLLENTLTPQAEIKLASHRGIPQPVRGYLKPTTSPSGERENGPGLGPVATLADSLIPPLAEPQAELTREEGVGKDVVLSM